MTVAVIDKETISRLKANEMSAFDLIYRTYSRRIFRFSYSIIKIQADAEDIVNDVFLKVWENRAKIDMYHSFESYLFTIAYNAACSLMRKKVSGNEYVKYLKSVQNTSQSDSHYTEMTFSELNEKYNQIIEDLPTRQKHIYKLSREDGLTYKEIASRLNISQNTVETHMERAFKTLRRRLGDIYSLAVLIFYYLFI